MVFRSPLSRFTITLKDTFPFRKIPSKLARKPPRRRPMKRLLLLIATFLLAMPGTAPAATPEKPKPPAPAPFTPAADQRGAWAMTPDPALPNVLVIGDSISIGYTREVRKRLEGRANVYRPMNPNGKGPDNCGDTTIGLANLDRWLAGPRWDVIHFNWGLWDLCYRDAKSKNQGNRDKVNGKISTPPPDYERQLEALVLKLKATGAKLIWASTTLVPEGEDGRLVGDDVKYNVIAARVMQRHGIPTDDLHALTKTFPAALFTKPGDVHYTAEGYAKLAAQVAGEVTTALKKPVPPGKP